MQRLLEQAVYGIHGKIKYNKSKELIGEYNLKGFKMFSLVHMLLSFSMCALNITFNIMNKSTYLYLIVIVISFIFFVSIKKIYNWNKKWLTIFCYIYMILSLVIYKYIGFDLNSNYNASSIYILYIVSSILIIDVPFRYSLIMLLFTIWVCIDAFNVKSHSIAVVDCINCCFAYIISVLISYFYYNDKITKIIAIKKVEEERDYDCLTGVRSRINTERDIDNFLKFSKPKQSVLLVIDLDNFKKVNDNYGHSAGDDVLRKVAIIMKESFRKTDYISRIGGDEFVVFLETIPNKKFIINKSKELIKKIKNITINKETIIGCSVGIAFSDNFSTYKEMFKEADKAMYDAKKNGKGTYKIH